MPLLLQKSEPSETLLRVENRTRGTFPNSYFVNLTIHADCVHEFMFSLGFTHICWGRNGGNFESIPPAL